MATQTTLTASDGDTVTDGAATNGALNPPTRQPSRPDWTPNDPIATWLALGHDNIWISRAWDPPFDRKSFHRCADRAELLAKMEHGNWCLGQSFWLGDLCFIQQVDGGDEWLTIKQNVAFESVTFRAMIRSGRFESFLDRIEQATLEQCRQLEY